LSMKLKYRGKSIELHAEIRTYFFFFADRWWTVCDKVGGW
jgi:hypothetical protein